MAKLKEALQRLTEKLQSNEALLQKARRRHKKFRERAEANHAAQVTAQEKGETLKADRCAQRALRSHHKAIYWKGKIRQQTARINHLERSEKELEAELAKWKKEHGIYFEGENKVRGGTIPQRLKAAQARAMLNYKRGDQPGYYSMTGGIRDYLHGLFHYAFGRIWDCSTYGDAIYICCGLVPPSGPETLTRGGFTETQLAHGRKVSEDKARDGDAVIFLRFPGDTVGHHMEDIYDHEEKVMSGHGDAAIDLSGGGSYDLFGDGLFEIRTYH